MASVLIYFGTGRISAKAESDARFTNVLEQQTVLKLGRKLIKAGDFEGALEKFNEALDPKYIRSDRDKFEAISSKVDVYVLQDKFQEALKEHDWIFERTPDPQYSIAKHKEILALNEWEKTKDNKIIYYDTWDNKIYLDKVDNMRLCSQFGEGPKAWTANFPPLEGADYAFWLQYAEPNPYRRENKQKKNSPPHKRAP